MMPCASLVPVTMPERRTLLLPVVIGKRELDGNLLLGVIAAEAGYRVLIGLRHSIDNTPRYGEALYLAKNVRQNFVMDRPMSQGHAIVAMDEEGLVRFPAHVQTVRYQARSMSLPRLLFAWGADNADYWRRSPFYTGTPILLTGNPRADLLRPELRDFYRKDADAIRQEFGSFVLLNTNFSLVNHFRPRHRSFRSPGFARRDFRTVWTGLAAHKRALLQSFVDLVPRLAHAVAPHRLVIRPHPSENAAMWHEAASSAGNVVVVHRGAVVPWLMASAAVLHNGCTSAVETALLGRTPYAYRPVSSPEFDLELPNAVSRSFDRADDLIAAVAAGLAACQDRTAGSPPREVLARHVESLSGPLASERILAALRDANGLLEERRAPPFRSRVVSLGSVMLDAVISRTTERRYNAHIFPDLDRSTITKRIATIMQLLGKTYRLRLDVLSNDVLQLQVEGS
jgi:surface carbohydrate biosynthesis protein